MTGPLAVVLAAGRGSRFTGDDHKLLTVVRGRPVVAHAVASALGSGLPVVVVEGAVDLGRALEGFDVERVPSPSWHEGIAASMHAGIAAATQRGADAVVIGLGDQPGVPPSAWRAVTEATATPIAVATYDGVRGNPVRLAADVWPLLPTTGDEGARTLIRGRADLVSPVRCAGDPADVDTLEDLARWS